MEALYLKQKSNEYKLLTELYFRLLPYQVLLLAINAINGIVDTLYASNVIGKAAMSAIGIFGPINIFLSAASLMLVSGSQILYGRYVTTKREKLPELFTVDLLIALGISLLSTAVLALAVATGLTRLLLSQQPDLQMLNRYILGQLGGIPPLLMGQQLFSFLSLQNQTRRTMIASVASFLSNIVFNHLFIVIFPMGTFGLGLGTALSNWVFFGIQAVYFLREQSELRFSLRAWQRQFSAVHHLGGSLRHGRRVQDAFQHQHRGRGSQIPGEYDEDHDDEGHAPDVHDCGTADPVG